MRGLVIRNGVVENIIIIDEENAAAFKASLGVDEILNEADYDPKPQIEWLYSDGVFSPPPPPEQGE